MRRIGNHFIVLSGLYIAFNAFVHAAIFLK